MIFATIITVPLESISVGLNREATLFTNELTKADGCLSLVHEDVFNAGPVFYLAHLYVLTPRSRKILTVYCSGFDLSAICLSIYHLMRRGGYANLLERLLGNGVVRVLHSHSYQHTELRFQAFVLLDALMNLVTFLASIGLSGIQNIGSVCSIVTAILSRYSNALYSSMFSRAT
jgi:hypothetical protein